MFGQRAIISLLHRLRARKQTAVDSIHNRSRADHSSSEISAIKALDGILASLDTIKFKVDVSLRVRIERDVDNVTIFLLSFCADIVFELLLPVIARLPVNKSA